MDIAFVDLFDSASSGDVDRCQALLRRGVEPNNKHFRKGWDPLHEAASRGHLRVCRTLIESGAKIDSSTTLDFTALHEAARTGSSKMCRLLLQHGANPNISDYLGNTPLLWAATHGHMEACVVLMEYGADVHPITKHAGNTALHEAAIGGHANTCDVLLAGGTEPLLKNLRGQTAMDLAPRKKEGGGAYQVLLAASSGIPP